METPVVDVSRIAGCVVEHELFAGTTAAVATVREVELDRAAERVVSGFGSGVAAVVGHCTGSGREVHGDIAGRIGGVFFLLAVVDVIAVVVPAVEADAFRTRVHVPTVIVVVAVASAAGGPHVPVAVVVEEMVGAVTLPVAGEDLTRVVVVPAVGLVAAGLVGRLLFEQVSVVVAAVASFALAFGLGFAFLARAGRVVGRRGSGGAGERTSDQQTEHAAHGRLL